MVRNGANVYLWGEEGRHRSVPLRALCTRCVGPVSRREYFRVA